MAPLVEIQSCLEKAQTFVGQDDKLPLASWYWETKKKLEDYKDKVEKTELEKIETELDKIKEELGI